MNKLAKKRRWVIVPCPDYDVPAMESWLEDQARRGLFLSKEDNFFLGFACFEPGTPKAVRYRLDAMPKERAFSDFPENKQAAIELVQELGWEFVAEWREFLIYRCDDAQLPELNTDPAVQALSLKRVQGSLSARVWSACYYLFAYPLMMLFLRNTPAILLSLLTFGTYRFAAFMFLTLLQVIGAVQDWRGLRKLRKHLQSGGHIEHTNGWRDGARRCIAAKLLSPLLLVLWLILLFGFSFQSRNADALPEQSADFSPIPTAEAFLDFPTEQTDGRHTLRGEIRTDPLAPEIYTLLEEDSWYRYEADYFVLRTPQLACWLANDLRRYDDGAAFRLFSSRGHEITPIDLPELNADTAFCYRGHYGDYRLILQKDDTVISVTLWLFHSTAFDAQRTAAVLLSSLSS